MWILTPGFPCSSGKEPFVPLRFPSPSGYGIVDGQGPSWREGKASKSDLAEAWLRAATDAIGSPLYQRQQDGPRRERQRIVSDE